MTIDYSSFYSQNLDCIELVVAFRDAMKLPTPLELPDKVTVKTAINAIELNRIKAISTGNGWQQREDVWTGTQGDIVLLASGTKGPFHHCAAAVQGGIFHVHERLGISFMHWGTVDREYAQVERWFYAG